MGKHEDYAVTVKVRNGRIIKAMQAKGIESVAELARMAECSYSQIVNVVGLKFAPQKPDGEWRDCVYAIAGVLSCDPEDLFTDAQRGMELKTNTVETFMSEPDVQRLSSGDPEKQTWAKLEAQRLIEALPNKRMQEVVKARMAGATYEEISSEWSVNKERIRQIEMSAIRRMRQRVRNSEAEVDLGVVPVAILMRENNQ